MFSFFSVLKVTQLVKRLFSIFMLLIFLFNGIGYYGLFYLTRQQLQTDILHKLDAGTYTDSQTVTLKIPFALPYQLTPDADYERVNGDFRFQGDFYKLVKQKLVNDTLYIICIRDNEEKRLNTVVTDFIKINHSLPASSKALKLLQGFCKDFESGLQTEVEIHSRLVVNIVSKTTSQYVVSDAIHAKTTPPPECLA